MSGVIIPQMGQNNIHCTNLHGDRDIGEYWEKQFCRIAAQYGKSFTPMQIGRKKSAQALCYDYNISTWNHHTMPDITIWTYPGEHHEIKHKNPTSSGRFGLEVYRFDDLIWFANETLQTVMYTIHNHDLAGGRDVLENNIDHWVTVNIKNLNNRMDATFPGYSWVNGEKKEVNIHYWSKDLWIPLKEFWAANSKCIAAAASQQEPLPLVTR